MQKFLLSYFLLIVIPLALLSTLTYRKVSGIVENYITFSANQAFEQTSSFLSYKLYRFIEISDLIRNDNNIINTLNKDADTYDLHEQIKDMVYLRQYLHSFEDGIDICKAALYVNDNFAYSGDNVNLFPVSQAEKSKWYAELKKDGKKDLWCPSSYLSNNNQDNGDFLSVIAAIKNPTDYSKFIGYLQLNFKKQVIDDIIKKANAFEGSLTYIQNSAGVVVCSSNTSMLKKYGLGSDLINSLSNDSGTLKPVMIGNSKCLAASFLIDGTDWNMVTVIPYNKIGAKVVSIGYDLLLLMSIIATVAFSCAFYFSRSLNKRISKLIRAMRKVHNGNFDTFIENSGNDEIAELIDNYNYMLSQISILIEEQYKSGKAVKNAELKALQAQINPHFLYNTLDMINWMSYKNMNVEISSAVKSLAKFYKLSLNKGKSIISIKDELTHVSLYVQIQNMRYSNRINLNILVNEEIQEFSIPKITLQPIVENSILHGILGKENQAGNIIIKGIMEDEDILISIEDDGAGIPEDVISKIFSDELNSRKGSGYGIKNINERLKISYGEKYGISFESEIGVGTKVKIRIPAKKYDNI